MESRLTVPTSDLKMGIGMEADWLRLQTCTVWFRRRAAEACYWAGLGLVTFHSSSFTFPFPSDKHLMPQILVPNHCGDENVLDWDVTLGVVEREIQCAGMVNMMKLFFFFYGDYVCNGN